MTLLPITYHLTPQRMFYDCLILNNPGFIVVGKMLQLCCQNVSAFIFTRRVKIQY